MAAARTVDDRMEIRDMEVRDLRRVTAEDDLHPRVLVVDVLDLALEADTRRRVLVVGVARQAAMVADLRTAVEDPLMVEGRHTAADLRMVVEAADTVKDIAGVLSQSDARNEVSLPRWDAEMASPSFFCL